MKIALLGRCPNNMIDINQAYSWFIRTVYDGLKINGHNIYTINYKENTLENIESELFKIKPHVLFTHLTFHNWHPIQDVLGIFDNLRSLYGTKIVHTMQDARNVPRYDKDVSFAFDMALIGQTQNIKKFSKLWNIPVYFWPYCSETYDFMSPQIKKYTYNGNAVFFGSVNAHNDRREFINNIKNRIPITTVGHTSKKDHTPYTASSADCILALCTGYDIKHYTDCRYWQYGGAGGILLGRKFNSMDDLIPPDLYYGFDSYDSKGVSECIKLYKKLKSSDNTKMRKNMFEFIQTYHNSKVRMKQTIELIMGERDKLDVFLKDLK